VPGQGQLGALQMNWRGAQERGPLWKGRAYVSIIYDRGWWKLSWGERVGVNLLPEHLRYSQNIRMGSGRAFLGGFTGVGGISRLTAGLSSLTPSGISAVPFHGPRTEYQPPSSA